MNMETARSLLPLYAAEDQGADDRTIRAHYREIQVDRFKKRYGLTVAAIFFWGLSMIIGCCVTGAIVHSRTEKRVKAEQAAIYAQMLEAHKEEQAQAQAAEYFLSGEASREAAINKAVDAVAPVIAKLSTDAQKATEASCMLARVMNASYPNSFEEVAAQPSQWMFYDGSDKTFTQHDRDIAESIVRPYMESGIVPNGLTSDLVYGAWSQNDFVLRDSYQNSAGMTTWRFQG